jgi:hypothetical protein
MHVLTPGDCYIVCGGIMEPQPSKGGLGITLALNDDPASSARCVKAKPRDLCVLQTAWLFCMIMPTNLHPLGNHSCAASWIGGLKSQFVFPCLRMWVVWLWTVILLPRAAGLPKFSQLALRAFAHAHCACTFLQVLMKTMLPVGVHDRRVMDFSRDLIEVAKEVKMPRSSDPVQVRVGLHTGVHCKCLNDTMQQCNMFGIFFNNTFTFA